MAWTAPRLWLVGDMADAATLNTHVRDNLLALSAHAHGGGAGDGEDELNGPDSITFDDISAPSAPGAGLTILYARAGQLRQIAGAAGSEETFSITTHTH